MATRSLSWPFPFFIAQAKVFPDIQLVNTFEFPLVFEINGNNAMCMYFETNEVHSEKGEKSNSHHVFFLVEQKVIREVYFRCKNNETPVYQLFYHVFVIHVSWILIVFRGK